jgi:hypothetical protein
MTSVTTCNPDVAEISLTPALDAAQASFGELSDAELEERLRTLDQDLRRLEAEFSVALQCARTRSLGKRDGYRSLTAWQRGELAASPTQTRHRNRLAATVTKAPVVVEALLTGRLGVTQAQMLAGAATHPRTSQDFGASAPMLVDLATNQEYSGFATCLQHWQMYADPDGATRRAEAAHRRRWVAMGIADDTGFLQGSGGVLDTTEMREILERFTQIEFDKDWAICTEQHGSDACTALMPRTASQRRWDALHQIFLQAASTPAGAQLPIPTLNIVMDLGTYESTLTRMRLIPGQSRNGLMDLEPVPFHLRRCQTSDGVAIEPVEALVRSLHGHIRRVIFESPTLVTDLGRRQRLFTGAARDAVQLQATHCVWPGCQVRSSHCQHDHLRSWESGGHTSPANGAPLCGRHNRHKTKGYQIDRGPTGSWKVARPDGQTLGI